MLEGPWGRVLPLLLLVPVPKEANDLHPIVPVAIGTSVGTTASVVVAGIEFGPGVATALAGGLVLAGAGAVGTTLGNSGGMHKELVLQLKLDHERWRAGGARSPLLEAVVRELARPASFPPGAVPCDGEGRVDGTWLGEAIDRLGAAVCLP